MDLNVCSRRVHDGYATIRSRGRSRPRAVYRSDSEELLKEPGGPYALPRVSNSPLEQETVHQVPRWSDFGHNKFLENYGTLRRGQKPSDTSQLDRRADKIFLNTFSSSKSHLDQDKSSKTDGEVGNERLYDTVPSEEPQDNRKAAKAHREIDRNQTANQNAIIESLNNLYDTVPDECLKKIARRSESGQNRVQGNSEDTTKTGRPKGSRQPIYAVPNIPRSTNDNKFDCRLTTDGNYVPSGDLYRTTARYIEDINRNIAEIDKSYEELRCSSTLSGGNAAYGVINKIPRSIEPLLDQTSEEHLYSGFHRKRDTLAPMPPISPNFGENGDDRAPGTPIFETGDRGAVNHGSRFDFKIPRNPSNDSCRESTRTRPNSYGKLPPKLLPRSSSIENNSSRHSTGSTTTSSSTKSTESLYAICESLTALPRDQSVYQSLRKDANGEFAKKSVSYDANAAFSDVFVTMRTPRIEAKVDDHLTKSQGISQGRTIEDDPSRRLKDNRKVRSRMISNSKTMDDDPRGTYRSDNSQACSTIRRNRSCNHGDGSEETGYGKSSPKINCGNRRTNADSTTLRVKDQSSYCVPAVYSTTKTSPAGSQSRSPRQERIVDLHSEDDADEKRGRREKTIVSGRAAPRSNKYRCRGSASSSTGTIRRMRSSSGIEDNKDDPDDELDNDEETSLLGNERSDRKIKISSCSGTPGKHCSKKCSRESSQAQTELQADKNPFERRYGTLPYRRSKNAARPLHKSSEDVLDGERIGRDDQATFQRSCVSTLDVRPRDEDVQGVGAGDPKVESLPFYLMDATEVILKGQLERTIRDDRSTTLESLRIVEDDSSPLKSSEPSLADDDIFFKPKIEILVKNRLPPSKSRTRHNSLESEDLVTAARSQSGTYGGSGVSGFATLPRRGNVSKEQRVNETPRRLSGNVPVLEPLYEHAVSDPVKPRGNDNNVIPWWELATRKYRHRSCPALQDHVVQAFEQSLSNMNQRLKQLTATAEKKDSELQELRDTIERLRKQSAEAGLNGAASNGRRHTLGDSDSGTTGCTGYSNHQGPSMARQLSADSVTSLNSLSSACSASSNRKKKGWLGSFSKKFSRSRKNRHGSVSDAEDCKDGHGGELSAPNSPRLPTAAKHEHAQQQKENSKANGQQKSSPEHENPMTGSKSSSALYKKEEEDVDELKKQLRQKDLVLAEITLEALSLKDEVYKMKNQMNNLKQNNERLQQLVTSKSLTSSQSSLPNDPERRFSVAALSNGDHHASNSDQMEDLNVSEHTVASTYTTTTTSETVIEQDTDGKRINVAVYLGSEKSFNVNLVSGNNDEGVGEPPHCVIASVCISNKTSWDALDSTVRRCFKDYVSRVDPVTNLGLGVDYVAAYHLGEASRFTNDSQHPELLPCGYLIGHVRTIYLVLSGYSWLAVDTLIPKSIVQRLVSLLTEHRRLILCGPSGTGKSYLAGKLAHALVDADSDADAKDAAAVATFNVDHKSSKELTQYLAHIAERCDSNAADELPKVIILENLQHAASLGELFSGLLGTRHSTCPAIIGTMSQSACSTTNLQLHHNFRWVLCRKDMEPVKGFLSRYLRRKLLEQQLRETVGARNAEMAAVVEWLPRLWLHLNKFLETHSSSDVTIGPSLFLSCPMEVAGSQVWFTDLWNYSIIPYLVEAVKEGNGEAAWEDPAQFITTSYPWIATHAVHGGSDALRHLRPEDVGYDVVSSGHNSGVGASSVRSLGSTHSDTEGDPLLNMLMRLQEAANYSSPHSNDSDSVMSMDSSHTRHSEDLSTSTSSSRGVESAL